ncbi:hypothetical protein KSD_50340 [Ktedonobacter sp. SOSP1-85]|nr:hypothetical protein KSD_50340 [Ktedonobacter sp. SOSP1-85]
MQGPRQSAVLARAIWVMKGSYHANSEEQIDLIVTLAFNEELGVDIACINDVFSWEKVLAIKLGMNGCRHSVIGDGSRGGFHMGDEQREMRFTTFSEMHACLLPTSCYASWT